MSFEIAPLPYATDALLPALSGVAVEIHYEKHHKAYLAKLRKLTDGKPAAHLSLEDLIRSANGDLFNNAAQVWNHSFFWRCMRPGGGGKPRGALYAALDAAFGSFERFRAQFAEAAVGEFGSGWAWLVRDAVGQMRVARSHDAENPLQRGAQPLLALDVWEHAYYLDYRSERPRYVQGFLDHLVNWEFVAANLTEASKQRNAKARPGGDRKRTQVTAENGACPSRRGPSRRNG